MEPTVRENNISCKTLKNNKPFALISVLSLFCFFFQVYVEFLVICLASLDRKTRIFPFFSPKKKALIYCTFSEIEKKKESTFTKQ